MLPFRLVSLGCLALGALLAGTPARAQDPAAEPLPPVVAPLDPLGLTPISLRRHWDATLEMRATQILGETAPLLTAQWQRHWPIGIKVGGTFFGLPLGLDTRVDGVKVKNNVFGYGLSLEYEIGDELSLPSVGLGVSYGKAHFGRRFRPSGEPAYYRSVDATYLEPYAIVHVFNWRHLDFGVSIAYRSATSEDDAKLKSVDMSGASFGLSFRHEI